MEKAYITILRPINCFMSAFAVLIGFYISGGDFGLPIFIGMSSVFLICGAGMVINDYFDVEADKINKPNRPIPSGKIKQKTAIKYAIGLFFSGLFLGFVINFLVFLLASFNSIMEVFYAWKMKRIPLVGNIVVSYLVASTFVFGSLVLGSIGFLVFLMSLMAFFSNAGRELYKDINDVLGDKKMNVKTIAVKIGAFKTKELASVFIFLAILISIIPMYISVVNTMFLLLVMIADLIFILAVFSLTKHSEKFCKIAMCIALFGFLLGV